MFDRRNPQAPTTPTPRPMPQMSMESRETSNTPLLSIVGSQAKIEGKFDIADSIQIECEIGGELRVGGRLVIGREGVVRADVHTVGAVIMGHYEGCLVATGDVEITETGRVSGYIQTDSLVISKGGSFNGTVEKMTEAAATALFSFGDQKSSVDPAAVGRYAPPADLGSDSDEDSNSDSVTGAPVLVDAVAAATGRDVPGVRPDQNRSNHQNGRHSGKGGNNGRNGRDHRSNPPHFPGGEAGGTT